LAVEKMKMLSITGDYGALDGVIEMLIKSGNYQPEGASEFIAGVKGYGILNEENPYSTPLNQMTELFSHAKIKPECIPVAQKMSDSELIEAFGSMKEAVGGKQQSKTRMLGELENLNSTIDMLMHFSTLNVDLKDVFSCQFVKVRFGRIPAESYEKLKSYNYNPYVLFFPCSYHDNYYFGMYMAPIDEGPEIDRIFAALFFERLHLPINEGTPAMASAALIERRDNLQKEIDSLQTDVTSFFNERREECMNLYTQLLQNSSAYEIRRYGARYGDSFILMGWVPGSGLKEITDKLDKIKGVEYKIDDAQSQKKVVPPVKLKNARPFKPFEFLVGIYGLPSYNEIDPTKFVAITYTLLFGVMFADLGQGLVLALIGWLMYRLKGMALGRVLIPCGISGAVFGLVFGSVFGYENLLNPLYKAVGFDEKPVRVVESFNNVLLFSIGIGVFLLVCAMLINIYVSLKTKSFSKGLFGPNGIAGLVLYLSATALVAGLFMGLELPAAPIAIAGIILPLALILLKEPLGGLISGCKWKTESGYYVEGAFELFEVFLSMISNTVSFLRVGAFMLIHAVLMMVFENVSHMFGNPALGIAIMVFGNAFVLVLEGLLVGVQVLRLEFYEMFSRFYAGSGRPYKPVSGAELKR